MRYLNKIQVRLFRSVLNLPIMMKGFPKCISSDAKQIFEAAVAAVLPHQMISRSLVVDGSRLLVDGCSYTLDRNVHMVGFGKAVIGMARSVEDMLGQHLVKSVISVPFGIQDSLRSSGQLDLLLKQGSKVKVLEGAVDNLPDESAVQAADEIAAVVEGVGEDDVLIVLVSGGGSALLPSPLPSVSLEDKLQATTTLARKGATIQELNTVRKKLSKLKGGGLAQLAKPAKVITLILSDIIGDPLDLIASGPTVQDTSSPDDALAIISRLGVESLMPHSVLETLKSPATKRQLEEDFSHVQNVVVGSNKMALQKGCEKAKEVGYQPLIMSSKIHGEARGLAELYANLSMLIKLLIEHRGFSASCDMRKLEIENIVRLMSEFGVCETFSNQLQEYLRVSPHKPLCLIAGGETTVTLSGNGKGGRNQELALATAIHWHKIFQPTGMADVDENKVCQMILLSAGTDGQDGPTDATGAMSHPLQVSQAIQENLNHVEFLDNNDSYTFYSVFDNGLYLIKTGLTGTNVMDLHILLIKPV
ncbi:glycerate kinase-like [Anneissia japonica]|uniref:glycerate kinase-like n=1 Tax=Anneissia japonica TaxID=1529436 RepID=UPI001425B3A3|nr:glycerate kinase-like [Anneissia japonica]